MRFDHIHIVGFRNLSDTRFSAGGGLNYFVGPNGAGKTAILEALYFLSRGRSFRTQRLRDVLARDAEFLSVAGGITDEIRGRATISIQKTRNGNSELRLDSLRQSRMSDVARLTPLQVLLPSVGDLVFGGPRLRRSWLDWGMFHVKPDYLLVLREFQKVLQQRNALLRRADGRLTEIEPWTIQFVELSLRVHEARKGYFHTLLPFLKSVLAELAPELSVDLSYSPGWDEGEALQKLLGESLQRELKSGATQIGPHRADVSFKADGHPAAAMLSRGQGKMLATALKVGQASQLVSDAQRTSVFLIDDVGAELDESHSSRFFALLESLQSQIFATSAQKPTSALGVAAKSLKMFHVKQGVVTGG